MRTTDMALLSRRRARRRALAVATALLAGGCTGDFRARPVASLAPPTAPAAEASLLLTSDLHAPSVQRWFVIRALADENRERPADALLAVGDTVYDCGPDPTLTGAASCRFAQDDNTAVPSGPMPRDPRLARSSSVLAEIAGAATPPIPVFVALGNHDVATGGKCAVPGWRPEALSRIRACLEVRHAAPGWSMPGRHYVVDAGPIRVIVVDGNVLKGEYGGFTMAAEEEFVRGAARACDRRLCFLASHYPPATTGPRRRREPPDFLERVARIERAAGPFQAWLSGHHHDLQHLRTPGGKDVFVFGNSSAGAEYRREETSPPGTELLFHSTRWGFARLEAAGDRWWLRLVAVRGGPVHCCEASRGGPCEPRRCRDRPPPAAAHPLVTSTPGGGATAAAGR